MRSRSDLRFCWLSSDTAIEDCHNAGTLQRSISLNNRERAKQVDLDSLVIIDQLYGRHLISSNFRLQINRSLMILIFLDWLQVAWLPGFQQGHQDNNSGLHPCCHPIHIPKGYQSGYCNLGFLLHSYCRDI